MKKLFFQEIMMAVAIFFSIAGYSQKDSIPHRFIGIGIRTPGLQFNDIVSNATPVNRLLINYDPIKYFRIEVQYGMYDKKTTETVSGYYAPPPSTVTLETKSTFIGMGIMGLYSSGKARFVGGIRYSVNNYFAEQAGYYSSSSTVTRNTGTMTLITGMIGGEYFFVKYFSVGAEFSVSSVKDIYTPGANMSSTTNETNNILLSETSIVVRFYPF